ncbi:hypothetical protein HPSA_06710 [Helicobacter pylori SouthAfrica7]|uniref:Uncharacterized protein n=1 Tax=Helicobacter pylori (strain SouthAfrica7) TaxID=907239 RepID=E8QTL1_HELPW|nr:hypothetical protein HPSA_06710 [Helicobacter pylori SouthAfrica7]
MPPTLLKNELKTTKTLFLINKAYFKKLQKR